MSKLSILQKYANSGSQEEVAAPVNSMTSILQKHQKSVPLDAPDVVEQKLSQALAAKKASSMENIVGKESAFDRFMMGGAAGVTNMINSMGNMVGLVDDKTVAEEKSLLSPYTQTTASKFGEFGGEMVTMAPLGFIGKGAQVVNAGFKSGALKFLTNPWAAATVEGAAAGSVMGDPNERGTGAAIGATGGYLLNRTMALTSRVIKDGLVKRNPVADSLADLVQKKTGRKPFIPLAQRASIESADPPTAAVKGVMDFVSQIPSAGANLLKQSSKFADDVYETNLRQVFAGKKADAAAKVFRETGDMQKAIEAGKNAGTSGVYTETQKMLETAIRNASSKPPGKYTAIKLRKTAEKAVSGDVGHAPMRDTAIKMGEVLPKGITASGLAVRDTFHRVQKLLAGTLMIIPKIGPILSSKSFQNFLMGNTGWQLKLQSALQTGNGKKVREVIHNIRRTMGAQGAQSSPKTEEIGMIKNNMLNYGNQAAEALRGMQ